MDNLKTYELTNPQKSIWLTEQYFADTTINNICGSLLIKQDINLDILNQAINIFIQNNDSFKLRFKFDGSNLVQYFTDDKNYNFEVIDINDYSQIQDYAKKMVNVPFDLIHSRVFDFKLFKLSSGFGGFIVNVHHIISDAATFSFIATEIVQNYSNLINDKPILEKKYSYVDYINSEKDYLSSNRFQKDKAFWDKNLEILPETATIPSSTASSSTSCVASREEFTFDHLLVEKINSFCNKLNISMYNFLIAIYSLYIGKINNMDLFNLGTPILNRTNFAEKHTSGMFISTSLLKIDLSQNITFKDFVQNIAKTSISMLKHQKYNYQYILNDIRNRDNSVSNLYDIILSYQITQATDNTLDLPYETKWYGTDFIANTLDVHFHDNNNTGNLLVEYDYQVCKLSKQDITDMHNRILTIINQVLENENCLIYDIDIITLIEKKQILEDFNKTQIDYDANKNLITLFKEIVKENPSKIALFFEGKEVTYSELDMLSDNLANFLSSKVNYEDKVAIFLDKSIEMIVSILSILKLNAAFVPIDVDYPKDRIDYIMKDANISIALTTTDYSNKIDTLCDVVCLDNLKLNTNAKFDYVPKSTSSLAYVMYTSGSTGNPKGVMIEQKSIIRLAKNPNFINFSKDERILQTGSIVFDACTFEIWAALLNGFRLYILKKENLLNPTFLGNYITNNKISILWLTAPLFNQLSDINPYMFSSVKYLLTGGDVLSPKHINKVMDVNPNLKIINGYGPTENTTFTCCFNIDKKYDNSIPIGFPISGTTCYVVSKFGNLQPIGFPGELWTGGIGVSRGYLNKPTLTKEKFLPNQFAQDNSTLYKTGDLVKWNSDGSIDFIGRIDGQVKLRGFRIELNEINSTIFTYPDVKNSCTVIQNIDNSKEICSYIIPNGYINIDDLKTFLRKTLPNYMIPTYFTIMDSFPITVNGKINKAKLPLPTINVKDKNIIKPKTKMEKEIYKIVQALVPSRTISITDNFFDTIGLDSLNSMQLCSELYNYNVTIQDISDYPTIQSLANRIDNNLNLSHFNNDLPKVNIKNEAFSYDLTSVLLTGALGFLGMHILKELLLCNKVKKIYCLIRDKNSQKFDDRFRISVKYYFEDSLDNLIQEKVELVPGDFANDNFGMIVDDYNDLTKKITTVIHCGANVKHYGNFQYFNSSNVIGVENIIDFCTASKAKLAHISTVSVGGYQNINQDLTLSENDFNIGQTFDNHVYMITKYLAEYYILNAINNQKIQAKIFRIGNIMPRLSDNVFQINKSDNAMIGRLQTIVNLGELCEDYADFTIDFSPVDLCAKAILKLINLQQTQTIYHIYNNNSISIKDFMSLANVPIKYVSIKKFINDIRGLNNPLSAHILNDLQNSNIMLTPVNNDITTKILNSNKFIWNDIDKDYIDKLLELLN